MGSSEANRGKPEPGNAIDQSATVTEVGDGPGVSAPAGAPVSVPQHADGPRYQVHKEHARGGIGRVLVARDNVLERTVAIKELLSPRPNAQVRFLREAKLTARLQHPSIVPVHDAGWWPDSNKPFYSMKLVSGSSLAEIIAETRTLGERLAYLPQVLAVAEAIA